jgi:hypothetical protein
MTILYEKVGRRYKPVMTDDWFAECRMADMLRPGHLLVTVDGNCRSYMRNVDPDRAAVLAALAEFRAAVRDSITAAAEFRPKVTKLSKRHQDAYARYQAAIPKAERCALWAGSIGDGIDAAVKVLEARVK